MEETIKLIFTKMAISTLYREQANCQSRHTNFLLSTSVNNMIIDNQQKALIFPMARQLGNIEINGVSFR
jgi:hypothetical protein